MRINLPNQITIGRLFLAIIFFYCLEQYDARTPKPWLLDLSLVLFVIAALTDIVDGYLARKHNQVTSFGRVIDPFVDKILVLGAYIFLAGEGFIDGQGRKVTDVALWMVVLILGRELLVTSLRGVTEAGGTSFAANVYGKAKMALQSVTIGWILVTVAHPNSLVFYAGLRVPLIYIMIVVTVLSGASYLKMARGVLSEDIEARHMIRKWAMTGVGLGYAPVASGTFGSAGAILIALAAWKIQQTTQTNPALLDVAWLVLTLLASIGCVIWGPWAIEYYASRSRKPGDPGQVVIDEFAGQWIALVALPLGGFRHAVAVLAVQFFLFRLFDVIKPPPARQLERLHGGWGILLDDLAAGVYANIIGQIVFRWFLLWS